MRISGPAPVDAEGDRVEARVQDVAVRRRRSASRRIAGRGSGTRRRRASPAGCSSESPWLKTEYIGISRKNWRSAGRQPDSGLTPRSRVELALVACLGLEAVALVAPLDLPELRGEELHPLGRDRLAPEDRDQDDPDEERHAGRSRWRCCRSALSRTTRRMKNAWKIGVNSQASRLNGSVGDAGSSGMAARRRRRRRAGAPLAPGEPAGAGAGHGDEQRDRDEEERADPGSPGARECHSFLS